MRTYDAHPLPWVCVYLLEVGVTSKMKEDWKFWEKSPEQGQNFFILEGSCITGVNFAEEDRGFLGKKKSYIIAA